MANQQIFCNTPWYEAHIYWDGGLGICCQESRRLSTTHNIKTTSLREWFNSEPVKHLRQEVLSDNPTDVCSRCYHEEQHSGTSRRHRSNQKSVIFTKTAFQQSFEQSPGRQYFTEDGVTDTLPIDLHVDLGNYCNLACKMCWSGASSRIATQYVLWGHEDHRRYLGTDWTKDSVVWDRFLDELLTIPKLKNIHFMGGETLLTPKFEEFVDFMIAHERFDISLSFVTNGTVYKPELIEKLKKFPRVGIEISIETTTEHNDYIRQGSHVEEVIDIIKKYKQLCLGSDVSVTLRPSISALSIGYYHTLLKFALEEKLLIKSLIVTNPPYLNPNILPQTIRDKYLMPYIEILRELNDIDIKNDYNESDINNYSQSVKQQAQQVKLILCNEPIKFNKSELMFWCNRWDQEFGFNMLKLYPEFNEI